MSNDKITVCFIASNVEKYLFPYEPVIEQAKKIGKVLINVDLDSVDDTVKRMRMLDVAIIESNWGDPIGAGAGWLCAPKQAAVDAIETDLLLFLDLDELFDDAGVAWIKKIVDEDLHGFSGARFKSYNFYGDLKHRMPDDAGGHWSAVIVRLARKGIKFINGSDGFGLSLNDMETIESGHRIFHYSHVRPRQVWHEKNSMMFSLYNQAYNNMQVPWGQLQKFEGEHPEVIGRYGHLFEQGEP